MTTPITDRDLPEELMNAMMRLEEEAYRAGQHGCCEEGAAQMANPSCFGACEKHGPRSRAALSLLCHALAQWAEQIIEEAARAGDADAIRALAPRCPKCGGWGILPLHGYCDCSRGKAYRHWSALTAPPAPPSGTTPQCPHPGRGPCPSECVWLAVPGCVLPPPPRPVGSGDADLRGTFPGDFERPPGSLHTNHCLARMRWGDGECECRASGDAGNEGRE